MSITTISDNLFLSGFREAKNQDLINTYNIDIIINVAANCDYKCSDNVVIKKYNLTDDNICDISIYFDEIADYINENINNNKNILVHCHLGKSRSVSFILAYLMKYKNMTLQESYNHISKMRHIRPNLSFVNMLINYETKLYGSSDFDLNDYTITLIMFTYNIKKKQRSNVSKIFKSCNNNYDDAIKTLIEQKIVSNI